MVSNTWVFFIKLADNFTTGITLLSGNTSTFQVRHEFCLPQEKWTHGDENSTAAYCGFKRLKPAKNKFAFFLQANFSWLHLPFPVIACASYMYKICQTVAGISKICQFREFFDLVFGGFFPFDPTVQVQCIGVQNYTIAIHNSLAMGYVLNLQAKASITCEFSISFTHLKKPWSLSMDFQKRRIITYCLFEKKKDRISKRKLFVTRLVTWQQ